MKKEKRLFGLGHNDWTIHGCEPNKSGLNQSFLVYLCDFMNYVLNPVGQSLHLRFEDARAAMHMRCIHSCGIVIIVCGYKMAAPVN